ncbi:uncharacterized protein LOC119769441 [Culex quinquefasciatus]|uniref:uncharacterized protein LOC119769441 n=1 Tax=Culex quinquefasciatus TaxID=7176 RepID=UPI0018E3ECFB|nr:uncharacterized protein LOC119769441 [Culex quinquefasciatus]
MDKTAKRHRVPPDSTSSQQCIEQPNLSINDLVEVTKQSTGVAEGAVWMIHKITATVIKVRIGGDLVAVPPSNLALYHATKSLLMHGTSTRYPGYRECERCRCVLENPRLYTNHIRKYNLLDCALLPLCAGCLKEQTGNSSHGNFCDNIGFSRLNRVCFLCNKN